MTADTENLVLEHLRAIRATLGEHSNELAGIRLEITLFPYTTLFRSRKSVV